MVSFNSFPLIQNTQKIRIQLITRVPTQTVLRNPVLKKNYLTKLNLDSFF